MRGSTAVPHVVVVSDSALLQMGFESLAGSVDTFELMGFASSPSAAAELLDEARTPIIVLDMNAHPRDAPEHFAEHHPEVPVLVLSSSLEEDVLRGSLRGGARGFLYRDADAAMITESILWLAQGHSVLDPRVTRTVIDWARGDRPTDDHGLTVREIEVLRLISKGEPNKRIARELGVTENTVKSYLRRVFKKLGCSSRSAAAAEATRLGLL